MFGLSDGLAAPTLPPEAARRGRTREGSLPALKELPTPFRLTLRGRYPSPRSLATSRADTAYGAYQRGQYITAFPRGDEADRGGTEGCSGDTLLGELYNQGLGIQQDPVKAAEWYRLARRAG